MFRPSKSPRIFGLAPGVDFAAALVDGLIKRSSGKDPFLLARTEVFLNTQRMARRVEEVFDQRGSLLLPRLRLVTDLSDEPIASDIPPAIAPLRRRLELTNFVAKLLENEPEIAPQSSLYDLSDSLAGLMDEMHGEGVDPQTVNSLDVADQSGHWARALKFINIISSFYKASNTQPDKEARQRLVVMRLVNSWKEQPPAHPIVIAGSTGSRGTTALLMEAVSKLPQGAIILPGFDFEMPSSVWKSMERENGAEDHPQFRHKIVAEKAGIAKEEIQPWSDHPCHSTERNKVISLSLRPAPVTDQWLSEGHKLGDLEYAMRDVSLIEAPSPRIEAEAIALVLRKALHEGKKAALITPDRNLTRQVSAALVRWNIEADDSAGQPLALSPPGRFLRQVGDLIGAKLTAEDLLAVLKHPLTHSKRNDRREHLLRTRRLELHIRRNGPAFPSPETITAWATGKEAERDEKLPEWGAWVAQCISESQATTEAHLTEFVAHHRVKAELWAAGPNAVEASGGLWDEAAGRKALQVIKELEKQADAGCILTARNYLSLFNAILSKGEVRNPDTVHPMIQFLGTLEARVQSAEVIVLGSMNDGTWPEAAAPDPWLNRKMRRDAGLLLPERRIGLSAHDYEQAVAGKEVWISRSVRSEEAETVPSRWVNRLANLLSGLPEQKGDLALEMMRSKGRDILGHLAANEAIEQHVQPYRRPSPRPPICARPKELSVTQIKTLVRDPYSIYAEKVLGLRALDPLVQTADAPTRGIVIHTILEKYIKSGIDPHDPLALETLLTITDSVLNEECPWPTVRRMWRARIERVAAWFIEGEKARRQIGAPKYFETKGFLKLDDLDFMIKGTADRMDETEDGSVVIYDYKSGTVPSEKQQAYFDKQLLLEAAMVERGAFEDVGAKPAKGATYIGLGSAPKESAAPLAKFPADQVWTEFGQLIGAWMNVERGYTARLAPFTEAEASYYDHLARFGEWDQTNEIAPEDME